MLKAFTLIEILMIVAIISIMVALIIGAFYHPYIQVNGIYTLKATKQTVKVLSMNSDGTVTILIDNGLEASKLFTQQTVPITSLE